MYSKTRCNELHRVFNTMNRFTFPFDKRYIPIIPNTMFGIQAARPTLKIRFSPNVSENAWRVQYIKEKISAKLWKLMTDIIEKFNIGLEELNKQKEDEEYSGYTFYYYFYQDF